MTIFSTNRLCALALTAIASAAMTHQDAMAWSYGSWGSGGSYGSSGSSASYGSYGSSASYGSYGSQGGHGSHGGLFSRIRARRAARHAAASHGSYGSYGSSGSSASYGSYGSSASYGANGGAVYYGTPVETHSPVEDGNAPDMPEAPAEEPVAADASASIEVQLPADAKVFVNDNLTSSTGSFRSYVSNGLRAGRSYAYRLRIEFEKDGETVVENKDVSLRAGDKVVLSFGDDDTEIAATEEPVKTAMTLDVPQDARVFLAGAPTTQSGTQRSYITQRLAAGQRWSDYVVRVELERDGQTLVQEQTLQVEGGQSYELAFDFKNQDAVKIAQLNN